MMAVHGNPRKQRDMNRHSLRLALRHDSVDDSGRLWQ